MTTNDDTIRVISILDETTADGPGFRISIYCAGCENQCPGCHNPQTWDVNAGKDMTVDELFDHIVADEFSNVTFSGGDPMLRPLGFARLARRIKTETDKNIWCYTGYTFEHLMTRPDARELLRWIDVLVDGPFILARRDEDLLFRGSSNQRILDVPKSLQAQEAVLLDIDPFDLKR